MTNLEYLSQVAAARTKDKWIAWLPPKNDPAYIAAVLAGGKTLFGQIDCDQADIQFSDLAANCFDELMAVAKAGDIFVNHDIEGLCGDGFANLKASLAALDKKLAELRS